jgi:hypothetical protein
MMKLRRMFLGKGAKSLNVNVVDALLKQEQPG